MESSSEGIFPEISEIPEMPTMNHITISININTCQVKSGLLKSRVFGFSPKMRGFSDIECVKAY